MIDRTQTGVRLASPLLKVLKGLAEFKEMSLGDLLEGMVLHAFEGRSAFSAETLSVIGKLREVYGCRLTSADSHLDPDETGPFLLERTCEIEVEMPAERAIHLFTPRGEEAWVPGWRPTYLAPADGEIVQGMVFRTGSDTDETLWTCLAWQPEAGHVRYLRVTPASRVAFVDVTCAAAGEAACIVRVAYSYAPLSQSGQAYVEAMTEDAFATSIDEWATLIRAAIAGGRITPGA